MADPAGPKEAGRVLTGVAPEPSATLAPVLRITPDLQLSAAGRLVGDAQGARGQAARRMVTAAAMHGIDLSWMWGTVDRAGAGRSDRVRQACLVVPGSGKTAMFIISGPAKGDIEQEHRERVACIRAGQEFLEQERRRGGRDVRLAQALPEPGEEWGVRAFREAGFLKVGDLAYLRRPRNTGPVKQGEPEWPQGVTVRQVGGTGANHPDRQALIEALDRSYVATLDCPELCGLRETSDVLESHRSTGVFDPKLWWLVFLHGQPHGCMLLNRCPEHGTIELVYLGLSPELRGKGLGSRLLQLGLSRIDASGGTPITCAVDLRNAPALRLYERMGFSEFGRRVALVRPIAGA